MNFKDLLLRAKDGDQQAKEEIFLMYRPLLFKESCVNGIFDEDLFQELISLCTFSGHAEELIWRQNLDSKLLCLCQLASGVLAAD